MNIKVLYEDNHIIAVLKPAGVLTQGNSSNEESLMDMVKDYLKEKYKKPGNVFLGLVHRLDKPVSGIVLLGKTSKGASRLSEQFRNHTIQKTYHGIVVGKLEKQKGELKEKVKKISFFAEGFTEKTDEELLAEIKKATKTRTAELQWEVVKVGKPFGAAQGKSEYYSLLRIMPKTGRFHQIRIQMANMGHPILGDTKYGGRKALEGPSFQGRKALEGPSFQGIALCATAISFRMATGEKTINLSIDIPIEWKKYVN